MVVPDGATAASYIPNFYAPDSISPETRTDGLTPPYIDYANVYYPRYVWVDLGPAPTGSLFTTGNDTVDFNNLTSDQVAAINGGADLYNALGGNDNVTLPDKSSTGNYPLFPMVNAAWDPNQTFVVGAYTDTPSDTDTITGGNGDYKIAAVGSATVNITINGNGSSNITAGSGADTISITGTGTNSVTTGSGIGVLSISGGSSLTVNGTFNGSATIGANSTLVLKGAASGGPITFVAGPGAIGETLQIDGTTMPTNTIHGFMPGDTIDLAGVSFTTQQPALHCLRPATTVLSQIISCKLLLAEHHIIYNLIICNISVAVFKFHQMLPKLVPI